MLLSSGILVVVLTVTVSVLGQRQELRQEAAGYPARSALPTGGTLPFSVAHLPPQAKTYSAPNDTTPPQVSLVFPLNGSQLQSNTTVIIQAKATDNIAVRGVEFLANGRLICVRTTSPYTCSWQVPPAQNTTVLIVVRAYDLTGNLSSRSVLIHTR